MRFTGKKQMAAVMSKERQKDVGDKGASIGTSVIGVKGDRPPVPARPEMPKAQRGPRKFRRTSLTRIDHDSFPE